MEVIYLDNNATTQPAPEVVEVMHDAAVNWWANPSSVHRFGEAVRQRVELARASVAELINVRPRELLLTSGGTESNNLALRGTLSLAQRPVLITSTIEHSAIREPADLMANAGVTLVRLPVDGQGLVNVDDLRAAIQEHASSADVILISLQWANNETGVLQPMEQIAQAVAAARQAGGPRIVLHTDATQMIGKLPVNARDAGVDLLTLAAHKFHGPKGVGALFVRTGIRLQPQVVGGPQERERRGGTENTLGIIGMAKAAELAQGFLQDAALREQLAALRDQFEQAVLQRCPGAAVNSAQAARLWNTSNIGFPGLEAEAILLGLSERGVCASAGAACSSGSLEPSPVLKAMGIGDELAHGSVRFSLSRETRREEVDEAVRVVVEVVERLGRVMPV